MRILLSAFSCGPHRGSEEGVGWNWAIEAARHVAFLAMLEQHLQADADAEKGLAARARNHGGAPTAGVELAHAVGHRALPGEDHALGVADDVCIGRDQHAAAGPAARVPSASPDRPRKYTH